MYTKPNDAPEVKNIAKEFLELNHNYCKITDAHLDDDTWTVKASVVLFGLHSNKTIVIDARDGRIIGCK